MDGHQDSNRYFIEAGQSSLEKVWVKYWDWIDSIQSQVKQFVRL